MFVQKWQPFHCCFLAFLPRKLAFFRKVVGVEGDTASDLAGGLLAILIAKVVWITFANDELHFRDLLDDHVEVDWPLVVI